MGWRYVQSVTMIAVTVGTVGILVALRGFGGGLGSGFPWRILIVVAIVLIGAVITWRRGRR